MGDSVTQLQELLLSQAAKFRDAVGVLHLNFEQRAAVSQQQQQQQQQQQPNAITGTISDSVIPPDDSSKKLVASFAHDINATSKYLDRVIGHLPPLHGATENQRADALALSELGRKQIERLEGAVIRLEGLQKDVRFALEAISTARFAQVVGGHDGMVMPVAAAESAAAQALSNNDETPKINKETKQQQQQQQQQQQRKPATISSSAVTTASKSATAADTAEETTKTGRPQRSGRKRKRSVAP